MNRDEELFALCKEAYEKTGWKSPQQISVNTDTAIDGSYYIYTSDYLLEKLPRFHPQGNGTTEYPLQIERKQEGWIAYYNFSSTMMSNCYDTPIKALLKLTIALADAGEIK